MWVANRNPPFSYGPSPCLTPPRPAPTPPPSLPEARAVSRLPEVRPDSAPAAGGRERAQPGRAEPPSGVGPRAASTGLDRVLENDCRVGGHCRAHGNACGDAASAGEGGGSVSGLWGCGNACTPTRLSVLKPVVPSRLAGHVSRLGPKTGPCRLSLPRGWK